MLGSTSAAALDDAQAGQWIDVDPPRGGALSDRLLRDAVQALKDRLAESASEHAPKWSPTEQATLEELLQAMRPSRPALRPVLARAVAGVEGTGTFDAAQCGDALAIRRRERGAGASEPQPMPVIVFLERPPTAVQAWREASGP
jgi:hypothetical protein